MFDIVQVQFYIRSRVFSLEYVNIIWFVSKFFFNEFKVRILGKSGIVACLKVVNYNTRTVFQRLERIH